VKYTVVWLSGAQNVLADIWNRASDRPAVRAAADRIDLELKRDAHRKGSPAGGNRRVLHIPPLAVLFTADPGDCKATVLHVARAP